MTLDSWRQLLAAGYLTPEERAVVETQLDFLFRDEGPPPAGLLTEFARIESRAARRHADLLECPEEPETREAPLEDVLRWYATVVGPEHAAALGRALLRAPLKALTGGRG